jgi:hypothetical protein
VVAVTDPIKRRIQQSGKTFLRHWEYPVSGLLDLAGTNPLVDAGQISALLDMGAGIDFFVAYRDGKGVAGIATRAQYTGIYATITLRNRSGTSELAKACEAVLDDDARLRPEWAVHLYERAADNHLRGVVAAHPRDLARYYLDGRRAGHRFNHDDETPFVPFEACDLRAAGLDVREWWSKDAQPYQQELW